LLKFLLSHRIASPKITLITISFILVVIVIPIILYFALISDSGTDEQKANTSRNVTNNQEQSAEEIITSNDEGKNTVDENLSTNNDSESVLEENTTNNNEFIDNNQYPDISESNNEQSTTLNYDEVNVLQEDTSEVVSIEDESISIEEFNNIVSGISYADVTSIVGGEGSLFSEGEAGQETEYYVVTKIYNYQGNKPNSNAVILFQNDEVVTKSQIGLE
jgi:hypothetical protein